ncbi:MAG: PhoPQ-activated pathogenicity-related family protein [Acidobacteria bacterium]|nr:PhoPQ-activated pathogenicity-related family protein [Acidobacteriota bacterium]
MTTACPKAARFRSAALLVALSCVSLVGYGQSPPTTPDQTALDRYVSRPDPSYKYELVKTTSGEDYTAYVLDMTSQTWRSTSEVDRNVWKHWVTIIKPNEVAHAASLLFITGGSNRNPAPDAADRALVQIAVTTKSIVTELRMVPNQPLIFADDKKARTEDAMIAYTWDKFLRTGDETWPARLPMTKSAVRAMDTVTSFLGGEAGGNVKVDRFVVAGASKRGWTTWTTAAVDKRVVAIIPMVIDLLNIGPSFEHHFAAYGYYAPAVADYEDQGIMKWIGTPQYHALMQIEEPYEYRRRMTMPKFMINAADDQFFLPDSSQFYFNDLPGAKYLRYVPNADHSLNNSDAFVTALACYNAILTDAPLPRFDWKIDKDGTIRVKTTDRPTAVKLWQITNPSARDFRLTTIGPRWRSTALGEQGQGEYVGKVSPPKRGWTAYLVELNFPSGLSNAPFKFTTGVKVIPDTLPFLEESKAQMSNGQKANSNGKAQK